MERKLIILLFMVFSIPGLFAQGIFSESANNGNFPLQDNKSDLNGYARGVIFGGAKNVDYATLMGEVALKSRLSAGKTFLAGEVRFREGIFFDQRKTIFDLKETFAGYTGEKLGMYLGNQIVTWGRTDGFNPTNNLSPNDYFFLTPEADDQKLANFMVRSRIKCTPGTELEVIGIPVFKPSVYRYDLLDLGEGVSFSDLVLPPTKLKNASLALRLNTELPAAGFSISWFHGYDPFYGFNLDTLSLYPSTLIGYRPAVYRKNTLGADFEIPVKTLIFRGEMALNFPENPGKEMFIPFRDFAWTGALEHDFQGFTVLFEYIGKTVFNFEVLNLPVLSDPSDPVARMAYASGLVYYESQLFNRKIFFQQKKSNHALFVSFSKRLVHDLLNLELSGYYNLTSEEYFIRSSVKWNLSDALTASAGFSTLQGPDKSVFEKAGKVLNGCYIGLTASF